MSPVPPINFHRIQLSYFRNIHLKEILVNVRVSIFSLAHPPELSFCFKLNTYIMPTLEEFNNFFNLKTEIAINIPTGV